MPQYRYTVQQHNINSKFSARLSHVNVYHLNQPSMDIYPGYPYTKIIYVREGSAVVSFDQHELSVKEHDILILNPGNSRFSLLIGEKPLNIISLGIENMSFADVPPEGRVLSLTDERLLNTFPYVSDFIIMELQEQSEDYAVMVNMYLRIILIWLQRHFGLECVSTSKEKRGRDCSVVKEYLDTHYKQNLTLDILSAESGMNKYYLVHSFTKLYGCSPISYLNEKRIEESKKLLENTDMSIAEIASELGFSSQSYFSQSFKKNTYMTPNEYRRSTRLL